MDIVICTTGEILEHKKGNRENAEYFYWSMGRVPKNFKKNDKIFFAVRNGIGDILSCEESSNITRQVYKLQKKN